MKLTTEQRKHLVTRTFNEITVTELCVKVSEQKFTEEIFKVTGNFKDDSELHNYIVGKYRTTDFIPVQMKNREDKERKYAMYDVDFLKYGFILNDEDEG